MKGKKIGKYELAQNKQLGEGTFGKTYIGTVEATGKEVAIKVVHKEKCKKISLSLQNTKYTMSKKLLNQSNQNIAEYIDVVETGNNFYIVRQFCTGGNLKDFIGKKGSLPQKEVLELLVLILRAFHPLITKGVIHKNLTPQNLLFTNGVLKLSDFGQSKMHEALFSNQKKKATQFSYYQSPEVIQGVKGNFECDIWSLGIILFEALYGKCPWVDSTKKKDYLQEIRKVKLQFPALPAVSKGMQKFIMSCLMYDINDRAEWTQIFQSNLFDGCQLPKLDDLNQKFCLILKTLKDCIQKQNIDVERYFQGKQLVENNSVNRKKFVTLVKPIAPDITEDEIDFIYVKLDKNGDEQLQIKEFQDALIQFDIQLQGIYRRKADKLLKANQQLDEQEKKQAELTKIYQGMVENLQKKQVFDLYELYTESDDKMIGNLDFESFTKLLRKIDQTLIKRECKMVFEAFDTNGDKKISFNEFFGKMCQITGSPNGLPKC